MTQTRTTRKGKTRTAAPTHALTSVKVRQSVDAIREDFRAFRDSLTTLTQRRDEFAPVFMATFAAWHRETGRPFVGFVQALDPTIPAEKAEYQKHRSYQAALYLRRLHEAPETISAKRPAGALTPIDGLAMVTKTLCESDPTHADAIIGTIGKALHWRARDIERWQQKIEAAKPLRALQHVLHPTMPRLRKKAA